MAQHANSPVTLSTDAPDYFQLASDKHPNFAPSLTLIPSPAGTYIHVRYAANRGGLHTGQLLIDSVDETRTIALTGRSTGLLPIVRMAPSRPMMGQWAGLFGLAFLGGLAYVSYTNRCQLFPALCQDRITSQPVNNLLVLKKTPARDSSSIEKVAKRERVEQPVIKTIKSSGQQSLSSKGPERQAEQPSPDVVQEQQKTVEAPTVDRNNNNSGRKSLVELDKAIDRRSRRRTTVAPPTEESELEKALNQTVPKQL